MTDVDTNGGPGSSAAYFFNPLRSWETESSRSVLSDADLVAKLIATTAGPAEAGRFLAQMVTRLPRSDAEWHQLGRPTYTRDAYKEVLLAALAAVGSDAEMTTSFLGEVRGSLGSAEAILPVPSAEDRRVCVLRPWNFAGHNPRAIAQLAAAFLGDAPADELHALLSNRFENLRRYPVGPGESPLVRFDNVLAELTRVGLPEMHLGLVTDARRALESHIRTESERLAQEAEQSRRESIIGGARRVGRECRESPRTIEKLSTLVAATDRIAEFDDSTALTVLLQELNTTARDAVDEVSQVADEMLEDRITAIAESRSAGTREAIEESIASAVSSVLYRWAQRATTVEDDQVVIDEPAFDAIVEGAAGLGINFDAENARRDIVSSIPRRQQELDAQRLVGVGTSDLPSGVIGVHARYGVAYLDYANVGDLINDIQFQFVHGGRSPEDVEAGVVTATGSTTVSMFAATEGPLIFETLSEELRAWHASGSEEPFSHSLDDDTDGEPYKYSGTAFTGNRFQARHNSDGSIRFSIGSGGYASNPIDPSYNLVDFANAVGRAQEVRYASAPELIFSVVPAGSNLDRLKSTSLGAYSESPIVSSKYSPGKFEHVVTGVRYEGRTGITLDAGQLVRLAAQINGVSLPEGLVEFPDEQASRVTALIRQDDRYGAVQLRVDSGPVSVNLGVDRGTGTEQTLAVGGGRFVVPKRVSWTLSMEEGSEERPNLLTSPANLGIRFDGDGVSPTEATRRTRAFMFLLGRSNRDLGAEAAPGWKVGWHFDSALLRLNVDQVAPALAAEIGERIAAGPPDLASVGPRDRRAARPPLPELA